MYISTYIMVVYWNNSWLLSFIYSFCVCVCVFTFRLSQIIFVTKTQYFSQSPLENILKQNVFLLLFKIKPSLFLACLWDGRHPGTHLPAQSSPTHCSSPQYSYHSGNSEHILTESFFLPRSWFFLPFNLTHFHPLNLPVLPHILSHVFYSFSGLMLTKHLSFTAVKPPALLTPPTQACPPWKHWLLLFNLSIYMLLIYKYPRRWILYIW